MERTRGRQSISRRGLCHRKWERANARSIEIDEPTHTRHGKEALGPVPVRMKTYAQAEKLLPWNVEGLALNSKVKPRWVFGGKALLYRRDTAAGPEFTLVDAETGEKSAAFDHARLMGALERRTGGDASIKDIAGDSLKLAEDGESVTFDFAGSRWTCDLSSYSLRELGPATDNDLRSPDGTQAAFVRGHDLYVRAVDGAGEVRLTSDGAPHNDYASRPESYTQAVTDRLAGTPLPPLAAWAPDSTKLVTHRLDQRRVGELHLVQTALGDDSGRPRLHSYRYALPGDAEVPTAELVILDSRTGERTDVDYPALPCATFSPFQYEKVWWSEDSRHVYFIDQPRDFKALRLVEVAVATGAARVVLEETSDRPVDANLYIFGRPNVRVLSTGEVVWFSERDGWGHLYLYDGTTGSLKRRITSGEWVVREIVFVDEAERRVYFTGGGREPGRNPYYRHLYRASLDGSEPELLTPEDAEHEVYASPDGQRFADVYSRVDLPPRAVLRDARGRLVCEFERADVSALEGAGWTPPVTFSVTGADGETTIHGVMYLPSDFDAGSSYPVIDSIYPGPQHIRSRQSCAAAVADSARSLAELGFVVVTMDGRGTPLRSRAFLDASYGRLETAGGLEDHAACLRELASARPYMDIERTGIYGHSAGGYATVRAMLTYPDLYKAGVSSAGNHDQRVNVAMWGERYIGLPQEADYEPQANANFAAGLRGKLLLAYADMDDNVHPAGTVRLVDALVKANKDFELVLLPNRNHLYADDPYLTRRRWDFFVRHLMGEQPPEGFRIAGP